MPITTTLVSSTHIDGLSLSMFEALRGLRDAVAPESGNLGASVQGNGNEKSDNSETPDTDELWHAYKAGDPEVIRQVQNSLKNNGSSAHHSNANNSNNSNNNNTKLTSREDFVRWHAKMEMEKDTELVMRLASTVLEKSSEIDRQVDEEVPGMNRTRAQQMEYLEELIQQNQQAAVALQEAYDTAKSRRDSCRQFIKDKTSAALGIEEDDEMDVGN